MHAAAIIFMYFALSQNPCCGNFVHVNTCLVWQAVRLIVRGCIIVGLSADFVIFASKVRKHFPHR